MNHDVDIKDIKKSLYMYYEKYPTYSVIDKY